MYVLWLEALNDKNDYKYYFVWKCAKAWLGRIN